jgi:hypothetical protein
MFPLLKVDFFISPLMYVYRQFDSTITDPKTLDPAFSLKLRVALGGVRSRVHRISQAPQTKQYSQK